MRESRGPESVRNHHSAESREGRDGETVPPLSRQTPRGVTGQISPVLTRGHGAWRLTRQAQLQGPPFQEVFWNTWGRSPLRRNEPDYCRSGARGQSSVRWNHTVQQPGKPWRKPGRPAASWPGVQTACGHPSGAPPRPASPLRTPFTLKRARCGPPMIRPATSRTDASGNVASPSPFLR